MDRRDERRKHRLTYPGTTSAAESQQMLHDYKDAVVPLASGGSGSGGQPVLERGGSHERADSKEKEHGREGERLRRQTPPADGGTSSPRMQNRVTSSTPTKHLSSSQSSANRAHQSNMRKQHLEQIRRDLQQFKPDKRLSDPGFHAAGKETVEKKMLEELISYGYSEVREACVCTRVCGTT